MPVNAMRPGVARRVSPLVRRIVAPNPGMMTGPGTNTYLVGRREVAVIDPGPADRSHIDAILSAAKKERIVWVVLTHTHPDHWPAAKRIVARHRCRVGGAPAVAQARRVRSPRDATPG